MTSRKVRIIYNDDASVEEHLSNGEKIQLEGVVKTAEEVQSALHERGYDTAMIPLRYDRGAGLDEFISSIEDAGEDVVFNLCEAAFGISSYEMNIAALLELKGVRYTGSGPLALGLSLDKGISKDILTRRGVMTPGYRVVESIKDKLEGESRFPLIVKPLKEDASLGIDPDAVVKNAGELSKRVEFVITRFNQPAIVEEYIDGREFNIAVLGNGAGTKVMPPAELTFVDFPADSPKICSYEAKWIPTSPFYKKTVPVCPAEVSAALAEELKRVALRSYNVMECRDYARVDVRLGNDGAIRVLEVNPNPDLSMDAGLARAAKAYGLDYPVLIEHIVETARARYCEGGAQHANAIPS